MSPRVVLVTLLLAFLQLAGAPQVQGQDSYADDSKTCEKSVTSQDDRSRIYVSIAEITFWGSGIQTPSSEQNELAESVKQLTHGSSVDAVVHEALQRVREGWQDRGYFQVRVTGEPRTLSSNSVSMRIAISVHVDEGLQYSLREMTFKHNKVLTNTQVLRSLFPIQDGEIFSRAKIAKGLETLNQAYGTQGFINSVSTAQARLDKANRLLSLDIDIDEGKQFYVRDIKVFGMADTAQQEVLDKFLLKRGDMYNDNLYRLSLERQGLTIPNCPCRGAFHMDNNNGIVDITLDFRPCE